MRLELKKIQAENAALAQKVQAGREGIADTERRIWSTVDEWKVRRERGEDIKTFEVLYCLFICFPTVIHLACLNLLSLLACVDR